MKGSDLIRYALVAGILAAVFGGDLLKKPDDKPEPAPVVEYTGSLKALHSASRSMADTDRENLSTGFALGADMLDADSKDLIDRTDVAQTYLLALLEFNYQGLGKPSQSYPLVSDEVEKVFVDTVGTEVAPMTAADRGRLSAALREMSKAIR